MRKIDEARETFRIVGRQASVLYFVLADLNKIDPMYQFSLDWYKQLFRKSIEESKDSMGSEPDRNKAILVYHTSAVFNISARSLFERHKLLLSLQMCVKLLISKGELNLEDWNFFLRGGTVLDRTT
jgi:dynein heavy chain, axonemal